MYFLSFRYRYRWWMDIFSNPNPQHSSVFPVNARTESDASYSITSCCMNFGSQTITHDSEEWEGFWIEDMLCGVRVCMRVFLAVLNGQFESEIQWGQSSPSTSNSLFFCLVFFELWKSGFVQVDINILQGEMSFPKLLPQVGNTLCCSTEIPLNLN